MKTKEKVRRLLFRVRHGNADTADEAETELLAMLGDGEPVAWKEQIGWLTTGPDLKGRHRMLNSGFYANAQKLPEGVHKLYLHAAPVERGEPVGRVYAVNPKNNVPRVSWFPSYQHPKTGDKFYLAAPQRESGEENRLEESRRLYKEQSAQRDRDSEAMEKVVADLAQWADEETNQRIASDLSVFVERLDAALGLQEKGDDED